MLYLYDQHEIVAKFVADLIPHSRGRGFGKCKTIGVIDEQGRLIGGLVYSHYDPVAETIVITGAATDPRWLSRETMRRMYQYPFLDIGVQMVILHTPADNERLLYLLARGGYTFIKFPRLFGRERDGVICTLTREAWEDTKFNRKWRHHIRDAPIEEAA